jgi:hypothetical protein
MDKEKREILKHISIVLDEMLELQKKPKGIVARVFEFGATFVTLLGALTVADVIMHWIGG